MEFRDIIHGFQQTDTQCPYCGYHQGMRERNDDGTITYTCWCGAQMIETPL